MTTATTTKTDETATKTCKVTGAPKTDLSASGCCHEAHEGQPVCEDALREKAYLKWEAAGYPEGDGVQFWLEAEAELLEEASK